MRSAVLDSLLDGGSGMVIGNLPTCAGPLFWPNQKPRLKNKRQPPYGSVMKIKHMFRPVSVDEERAFQESDTKGRRETYLRDNPMEKVGRDAGYAVKVERIRNGICNQTDEFPQGFILDVGGNTGGEAIVLQQQGGKFCIGDLNRIALSVSMERTIKFGLEQPAYVALDAHRLPFADNSFPVVTVVEALHHFPDYNAALSEILRVLKPGGKLFSIEPNGLNPIRRASEVRDRLRGSIERSFFHHQLYRLLRVAGFDHVVISAIVSGKTETSINEVPSYRRWFARLHRLLQSIFPSVLGSFEISAYKAGRLDPTSCCTNLRELLRTPGGEEVLAYDEQNNTYESPSGRKFREMGGIPILIE